MALASAGGVSFAEELHFDSGVPRVALLELFTSEGCSSCPPAEKWLGNLKTDPALWREFVPVAFHVDYWNRLGWPDRFSTVAFTQRQHALAKGWKAESVYTPCFVRDGREWRPTDLRAKPGKVENAGPLHVELDESSGSCRVTFTPAKSETDLDVHIVLLGGGFVSKVTAGENRGTTLVQEFVAVASADHPLSAERGNYRAQFLLPKGNFLGASRRAVGVWVTRRGELAPLQATGGWLK